MDLLMVCGPDEGKTCWYWPISTSRHEVAGHPAGVVSVQIQHNCTQGTLPSISDDPNTY